MSAKLDNHDLDFYRKTLPTLALNHLKASNSNS